MLAASRALRRPACSAARAFSSTPGAAASDYDVCVVGGGPGGYVAAIKAAQLGLKTVCVESRGSLGGTCLNVGCIPSKALLHSSHLYEEALHEFESHGIIVDNVRVDVEKMQASKQDAITGLTQGIEKALFKKYGVDYVKGHGKITGATQLSVELSEGGNQTLSSDNIIIASGSIPTPLPPVPVDNAGLKVVDSTGALEIKEVPERMAVIGGGVIGLEMGSVWRRLGSEVTVVEFLDTIIPGTDKEITKAFQRSLKKQGMKFKMKTKVVGSEVLDSGKVALSHQPSDDSKEPTTEEFDVVLVSTGRKPFTEGLGLEEMGIEMDQMGRVVVDEHFKTNIPSIFAIGDVIDGPMLAHKAEEEGIAAVEHIKGLGGHVNYDAIPGVIYTFPEVATVGKTEEQLKDEGTPFNKGVFPMQANSRARTVKSADGLVKILSHKETDQVLGVHIVGSNAGEMIMEGVIAVEYGASSEDIARTCHAHPTLSEAFKEAAMATYDKPIHF
jgi:dihydrolipoamide dehydrogenase